jgi:hypothetical protein
VARSHAALRLAALALRHQRHVLQRAWPRWLRLATVDRWPGVWLSRFHSSRERFDMARHQELLDAFADLRYTWDSLAGLVPEVIAASQDLGTADFIELERRVEVHRLAIDALKEAIEHEAMGRVTSSGVA